MAEDSSSRVQTEAESTEQENDDAAEEDAAQKLRRGNTVSRPPSSHITRVDEESSASDSGGRSGLSRLLRPGSVGITSHSVETVDRGVGPTPLPGPPLDYPHVPNFLLPHFIDPRNGLLESPYGLGYPYTHPFPTYINQPLPLSSNTLEGRYHWPPPTFHQPLPPGLAPSPIQSDISMLSMRNPGLPGESVTQLASRIQWEQFQRAYYHSQGHGASRRFSPAGLSGLPLGPGLPGDLVHALSHRAGTASGYLSGSDARGYLSGSEIRGYASGSDIPPTPGSGSITLPGSLEGSRLTSPRPSIIGGRSRKRALSHSPISDYLDIQSLTRSSEGSLQLTSFLGQHNSRSSSAASGSYGHLSAASLGTSSPHPPLPPNPYFRHGPMMPGPPFFYPPMLPPGMLGRPHPAGLMPPIPHSMHPHQPPPAKFDPQISTTVKEAGSSVVSSTMDSSEGKKSKIKKEAENLDVEQDEEEDLGEGYGAGHIPQEGEPDFIETNCHWIGCSREFETQDELVKHINQDHIQANKKSFVCRWKECSREEKPFKAQYMLVVHMRRHTGEKPHRCTFEGCNKAYSRLENLKTHLRSHTGEKPYLCEFPGCTKAFSNASDRAKHQNRTHSNAKPYACKASGCTKRYTDPSSLRKHVKTVHGPEFYANKKHKGDGCKKEDPDQDHDDKDNDGSRKVEDCLTVTSLQGGATTERRRSQDTMGSGVQSQPSPQSSPEVNVTCSIQPDIVDDLVAPTPPLRSSSVEEEVDIPEPDEAEVPEGSNALLTRRHQVSTGQVLQNRMKGRLSAKAPSPSILPQLPPMHSPEETGTSQSSFSELGGKTQNKDYSPLNKRISDLSARDQTNLVLPGSRRNSNTSTLSSYMSSMRSDTSLFPTMGSKMSSRRSSEASQVSNNRLSINNSPYEYDITGNRPQNSTTNSTSCSRRSSESSNCNIGTMSAMMQKANLGSHPNLVVQQQGLNPLQNPMNKYSNERLARYFAARKDYDTGHNHTTNNNTITTNTHTNTPNGTPLPDDVPGHENRRSSDPCRAQDPNFESLKRLQRFHSLNVMKPLPLPANMRSLQNKHNFHSSRSSIATDYSMPENSSEHGSPGYSFPGDLDADTVLDERLLEDNDDMIIPDDMQRFLNERYHNTQSQPTSEDMQRYYNERYNSNLSGSDHHPQQRQPSQMSFVDSAGVDSGCGSQMSGNSSSVGNFINEQQQVSPPMSQPMTPFRGQGHFSPSNLHVQTGFDSAMSSPMLGVSSPYSNQPMPPSPLPPSWPQQSPHIQGQGQMPVQGPMQCPVQMQGQYSPQQQHVMPHPQQQQYQHNHQMQTTGPMRSMPIMVQGGHYPVNNMMNMGSMGTPGNMGMTMMNPQNCPNMGMHCGSSQPMMHGMQNPAAMGQWHQQHSQQGLLPNFQNPCGPYPQQDMMGGELPGQVYSTGVLPGSMGKNPVMGGEGMGGRMGVVMDRHKPSRSSPQVQVPHISQSQIPPNAKAVSRSMMVRQQMMNQHMHSPQTLPPAQQQQQQPLLPSPQTPQTNVYVNNHNVYPNQYNLGPYPQMYPGNSSGGQIGPPNAVVNGSGTPINSSTPDFCHQHHRGLLVPPSGTSTPTGMFRHPHPPSSQHPSCQRSRRSPRPQQTYPHSMEMSPGCNQVTSSTDRKETPAPPIEDFMDNISSLSTENLIENISSENVFAPQTSLPSRSAPQNSNRFNPLLNTSNMVVNDMSSMLTQLAEENKYLSMRP